MLDKNYLTEKISSIFPDLSNTKFEINSQIISSFTLGNLLPFLVYQNTIDINHRLIGLYLPDKKKSSNILPFYVIMGQYRKLLDSTLKFNNYQNQVFSRDQIQVTYKATIYYILSIDFINRQIKLISGRGEVNLPFIESYKLTFLNKYDLKISDKIDAFEQLDNARLTNIFTFPLSPKESQYEGVIIFTNINKFESLIKTIKISGNDLRDHLNIEKVVFPSNGGHKFIRLSSKQTEKKPVSVLVARLDAFSAYSNILESGGSRYKHIKTIVLDEFDELLLKWEKADKTDVELGNLNETYFNYLRKGYLKDIYFICKNSRLNIHEVLTKNNITYDPWLIKPMELCNLDNHPPISPELLITNVGNSDFENLNNDLNYLIIKWKELAKSQFCNGEILVPITFIYELRMKINSFFNPETFSNYLKLFSDNLNEIKSRRLMSGQDFGLIAETIAFIKKNQAVLNFKLNSVIDILREKNFTGCLQIISENTNEVDINWMKKIISQSFSNATIIHSHKKDFLQSSTESKYNDDIICYLTADKYILGNALGNILAKDQVFILNNRGYSFGVSYSKRYQNLQIKTGSLKSQYHLLNINLQDVSSSQENPGIIPLRFYEKEISQSAIQDVSDIPELELNDWVEEIILKHKNTGSTTSGKYILFFDDGTFELLPETKRFYLYEDENEKDDIDKSFKSACELEPGEQIIIPKRGTSLKDLLEFTLKKNEHFSHSIEIDLKWRILINKHILRCKMDLNFFRRKLKECGFVIGSDQTVQHWIDGDTRRPDNFLGLLNALALLEIISKNEINSFDRHNSELKSIQIKFVRTAISKLISRLNGIDIEYDENFTDELLNNFIDHIEIKKITSLHKL